MIIWKDSAEYIGDARGRVQGCDLGADIYTFGDRMYLNILDAGYIVQRYILPRDSTLVDAKREAGNYLYQLMVDSQMLQEAA